MRLRGVPYFCSASDSQTRLKTAWTSLRPTFRRRSHVISGGSPGISVGINQTLTQTLFGLKAAWAWQWLTSEREIRPNAMRFSVKYGRCGGRMAVLCTPVPPPLTFLIGRAWQERRGWSCSSQTSKQPFGTRMPH